MANKVSFENNQYFVADRLYGMCIRYAKKSGFSFSDGPIDFKPITEVSSFCIGQAIFDKLTEYEVFIRQRKLQGYYLLARFYRLIPRTEYGLMYSDFVCCVARLDNAVDFELTEQEITEYEKKIKNYKKVFETKEAFLKAVMPTEYDLVCSK